MFLKVFCILQIFNNIKETRPISYKTERVYIISYFINIPFSANFFSMRSKISIEMAPMV